MNNWPDFMPKAQLRTWGYTPRPLTQQTEMDTGRRRTRRIYDNAPVLSQVSWRFNAAHFGYFEGWFVNRINGGADKFTMPIKTGTGIVDYTCQFIGRYEFKSIGHAIFEVTATLETEELQVYGVDTLEAIEAYADPDAYMAFIDRLEIFVNQDMPNSTLGAGT